MASSADGDVRNAVMALQMYCAGMQRGKGVGAKVCGKGRGKSGGADRAEGGGQDREVSYGRDCSIVVFRAMGRVLHCKREAADEATGTRGALAFRPEDALAQAQVCACVCLCVCVSVCAYWFSICVEK